MPTDSRDLIPLDHDPARRKARELISQAATPEALEDAITDLVRRNRELYEIIAGVK